ncbi:3D domain-containing protein [Desulfitobacterium dehalogenans]|nr:3D domain-containing protein [Desulfitobacterium dehalogenans]
MLKQRISMLQTEIQMLKSDQSNLTEKQRDITNSVNSFLDTWQMGVFEATAYSPLDDRNGMNSWGDGTVMSSGASTLEYIDTGISVDSRIVPLGSKIFIKGMGWRIATDTGGAIKNYKLDIPMWTFDEAIQFGRKDVIAVWPRQQQRE